MSKDNLSISKEAAKTIGLNQAVLLEVLNSLLDETKRNLFSEGEILKETSFWERDYLETILKNLAAKGLIKSVEGNYSLIKMKEDPAPIKEYSSLNIREDKFLNTEWSPEPELLEQISEYGIPDSFALTYVDEFKHLSAEKNERNHSWGIKFLRFVIKKWREQEITTHKENKRKPITQQWYPDEEAIEILIRAGVNNEFIEKEIPEFILYWSERNEVSDIWSSKFISHMRRQWAKSENLVENKEMPELINPKWNPNEDFYDVLSLTDITKEFADSSLPEFILYWKETGQAHNSWNSKFLQHVKYQWQRKQSFGSNQNIEKIIESSWTPNENKRLDPENLSSAEEKNKQFQKIKDKHGI